MYKQYLVVFWFISISLIGFGQDSTYYTSGYAGGYIVVPEHESWIIDRVFVNDGGAYSILINKANFEPLYHPGDTIKLPYYIADMELLDNKNMVQYQLHYKKD